MYAQNCWMLSKQCTPKWTPQYTIEILNLHHVFPMLASNKGARLVAYCVYFFERFTRKKNNKSNRNEIISFKYYRWFKTIHAIDDAAVSLQSMLIDIELNCNKWALKLNVTKTKVMIFESKRHTSDDFFLYNSKI